MVTERTTRYSFGAFLKHFLSYGLALFALFFLIFNAGAVRDELKYRLGAVPVLGSNSPASTNNNSGAVTNPFLKDEASMVIPAMNISAPIIFPAKGSSNDTILKDLENGVAHYPDSVGFGDIGTSIIVGHSSSPRNYVGNYAHVFSQLDKLSIGDKIYIFDNGKELVYKVYRVKIINPADFQNEISGITLNSRLVLMSCWPVGTNWNRAVVFADKIN